MVNVKSNPQSVLTEHVNNLLRILSKSATFFGFQLSQGSVATYCRCGGNLCGVYVENFPRNQLVKEVRKSVHFCQSYQEVYFFGTQPALYGAHTIMR